MPKVLEDCVNALMADPKFKPREGEDKRSAAYAVCTAQLQKEGKLQDKELIVTFAKANNEKRLVTGIVLQPDIEDSQGDVIKAEEIEMAAYDFMERSQRLGLQHREEAERGKVHIVESYIAPLDFKLGEQPVSKGSWVMTVRIPDDELWNSVKKGAYTGFSIHGYGERTTAA